MIMDIGVEYSDQDVINSVEDVARLADPTGLLRVEAKQNSTLAL